MARVLEALWRVDRVGSVTKLNCRINFFLIDSVVVFSCQEHCAVSNSICFARVVVFCFRFLTWYHCCFRWLFLGFQSFFIWFELGCLKSLSLSDCFVGLGFLSDLFFFKAPVPSFVGCRPLFAMFFAGCYE